MLSHGTPAGIQSPPAPNIDPCAAQHGWACVSINADSDASDFPHQQVAGSLDGGKPSRKTNSIIGVHALYQQLILFLTSVMDW